MTEILLVSNPSHAGVTFIADAYNRAFQHLGIEFDYFEFRKEPKINIRESNIFLYHKIMTNHYKKIIMIQPTYIMYDLYLDLVTYKNVNGVQFYCINTEDPYSTSAIIQMNQLFNIKFTNEKVVADRYKVMGFEYLPVAFDSLFPFKKNNKKDIDVCYISTFYGSRLKYLEALNKTDLDCYVAGNLAPLVELNKFVDTKLFKRDSGLMSRHKELEIYSRSKFVINPHRIVDETGYDFLKIEKGMPCQKIIDEAVSPNPRFFDAVACGTFPLNDISRTECFNILKKYDLFGHEAIFELPFLEDGFPIDWFGDYLQKQIDYVNTINCTDKIYHKDMAEDFANKENYIERAKQVLDKI